MDSMVDGPGKEISAGTQDNVRRVDVDVYYADENVMVAVVPNESRGSPMDDNGKDILVFLREENLEEKLDALRVS